MVIKKFYEKLNGPKLNNLDEIHQLLERQKLPKTETKINR